MHSYLTQTNVLAVWLVLRLQHRKRHQLGRELARGKLPQQNKTP